MNLKKTMGLSVAAAAVAVSASFAPVASAEVSASVGIANMYLWRGYDLGFGSAAISGDITYSVSGFHAGVWGSSGDEIGGTEYDLIVGYGGEAGDFSYDLSIVDYVYQESEFGPQGDTDIGDFMEYILSLGYGPVSFSYYDNFQSEPGTYALGEDYSYFTLSVDVGDFSFLVGRHDPDGGTDNPTHLDITYNYNDNLSFTVSKLVADEDSAFNVTDKDANFVVSYSVPIE